MNYSLFFVVHAYSNNKIPDSEFLLWLNTNELCWLLYSGLSYFRMITKRIQIFLASERQIWKKDIRFLNKFSASLLSMYNMSVCLWCESCDQLFVISLRDFPSANLPFFHQLTQLPLIFSTILPALFYSFHPTWFCQFWFFKIVFMLMCLNTFSEICFAWISFDFLFFCFLFLRVWL